MQIQTPTQVQFVQPGPHPKHQPHPKPQPRPSHPPITPQPFPQDRVSLDQAARFAHKHPQATHSLLNHPGKTLEIIKNHRP